MEFDEQQAIDFIREHADADLSTYDDDQILNVIDIIFDWYEDNGFLDPEMDDEDEEPDVATLAAHVKKMLLKDKGSTIAPEHVEPIVFAELDYENSLLDI